MRIGPLILHSVVLYLCFVPNSVEGQNESEVVEKPDYTVCVDMLEDLAYKDLKTVKLLLTEEKVLPPKSKLRKYIKQYAKDAENSLHPSDRRPHEDWTEVWMERQAAETADNPIAVFRLLSRLVNDWKNLSIKIQNSNSTLKSSLNDLESQPRMMEILKKPPPNDTDILDTAKMLIFFHIKYEMSVADIAAGIFPGKIDTGIILNARHYFTMGKYAVIFGKLPLAIQWLSHGLRVAAFETSLKSRSKEWTKDQKKKSLDFEQEIYSLLLFAVETHNDDFFIRHTDKTERDAFPRFVELFNEPNEEFYKHLEELVTEYETELRGKTEMRKSHYHSQRTQLIFKNLTHLAQINQAYLDICRGHFYQTEAEKAPLFCWLERKKSWFYAIGPMKMEFLSRDPDIVQVYNVIGPRAMKKLDKDSRGKFERGLTLKAGMKVLIDFKVAMDLTVDDSLDLSTVYVHGEHLFKIPEGPSKLSKYSFTGKFDPHVDAVCGGPFCDLHDKERLANYFVYLSKVRLGGETAFPLAGFRTEAVPGSALLWYNVRGNGDTDFKSTHASCPVLLGRKLKHTELVMYNPKFHTHKCPLDPHQGYRISVNGEFPK